MVAAGTNADGITLALRIISEAMAVREQQPPGNKLPLQHLLLFVRLVGQIGSICGCSTGLENGHHGAARPPAALPKHLKVALTLKLYMILPCYYSYTT